MSDEPKKPKKSGKGSFNAKGKPILTAGKKPHGKYGHEVLNGGVKWDLVINRLVAVVGKAKFDLAAELELPVDAINQIIEGNYTQLNFRRGARLLGIYYQYFPEEWI